MLMCMTAHVSRPLSLRKASFYRTSCIVPRHRASSFISVMGERSCFDMSTMKEWLYATNNKLGPKGFTQYQVKGFGDDNVHVRIDLPHDVVRHRFSITPKALYFSAESLDHHGKDGLLDFSGTLTLRCDCRDITGVDSTVKDGVLTMIVSRVQVKDLENKCPLTLLPFTGHEGVLVGESAEGCLVVNLVEMEPMTADDFDAKLDASLKACKDQGKEGISIKLPRQLYSLIDIAVKKGFTYDHAENDYVMLTSTISETTITIGIFAFVLNKNREVLVVQKTGTSTLKGPGVWNLPTGVLKDGEGILAGAVKEVQEEVGIKAKFVQVLGLREIHQSFLERKTDIFFLCEFEIKKQDPEILDVKWMPVEEYLNQPLNDDNELFVANTFLKRSQEKEDVYCNTDQANKTCDQATV